VVVSEPRWRKKTDALELVTEPPKTETLVEIDLPKTTQRTRGE
jgi:hypothetical protein